MGATVLGRTNLTLPSRWLKLGLGSNPAALAEAALQAKVPLDLSGNPALWAGHLRGREFPLITVNPGDVQRATDSRHAYDLVHAHLIETLCALGREQIHFYFLPVKRALQESQLDGILSALEDARAEGHVQFFGLKAEGSPYAALSTLQFHDGFELLMFEGERARGVLAGEAEARRIGIIELGANEAMSGQVALRRVTEVADLSWLQVAA